MQFVVSVSVLDHTHTHMNTHCVMDLLLFSVAVIISCIVCKFIFPLFKYHVLRIVQTIISASCLNDFASHPAIYLVFYAIFSRTFFFFLNIHIFFSVFCFRVFFALFCTHMCQFCMEIMRLRADHNGYRK